MNKPSPQILDMLLETRHGDMAEGVELREVDFSACDLASISLEMAHVYKSSFKTAALEDAGFLDCLFDDCDFSEACFNGARMHDCRFTNSSCKAAQLVSSQLSACTINESDFSNANLENADLWGSTFENSYLICANLKKAQAQQTSFRHSDLTGADLSEGDFTGTDFRGAMLTNVCWDGAILTGAKFDAQASKKEQADQDASQLITDPTHCYYLAEEYLMADDFDEALAHFNRAIELDPLFYDAYIERARAYRRINLNDADAEDYSKAAIDDYSKAISVIPKINMEEYFSREENYSKRKDKRDRVNCYRRISEEADLYWVISARAIIYSEIGEAENAIRDLTKAIEVKPDRPDAYIYRSDVYMEKGEFENALNDILKAGEVDSFTLNINRADIAELSIICNNPSQARKHIEIAIKKEKERTKAIFGNEMVTYANALLLYTVEFIETGIDSASILDELKKARNPSDFSWNFSVMIDWLKSEECWIEDKGKKHLLELNEKVRQWVEAGQG